jgi:alpha,alpha-trehalase
MEEHLTRLWPVLTRKADDQNPRSSLIPLPYDYVVPGGRFSEIYYWDSYFTILGLKAQKRYDLIQNMVKNFAHLIDTNGFIPNGNRNYYLTRSQPPFFSLIVRELEEYDSLAADHYLEPW